MLTQQEIKDRMEAGIKKYLAEEEARLMIWNTVCVLCEDYEGHLITKRMATKLKKDYFGDKFAVIYERTKWSGEYCLIIWQQYIGGDCGIRIPQPISYENRMTITLGYDREGGEGNVIKPIMDIKMLKKHNPQYRLCDSRVEGYEAALGELDSWSKKVFGLMESQASLDGALGLFLKKIYECGQLGFTALGFPKGLKVWEER